MPLFDSPTSSSPYPVAAMCISNEGKTSLLCAAAAVAAAAAFYIESGRTNMFGSDDNAPDLLQDAYVTQALRPNVRVTLQMGAQPTEMTLQQPGLGPGRQVLFGQLAQPSSPRVNDGTYWGYTTRLAPSLSQAFQDCPFAVSPPLKEHFQRV